MAKKETKKQPENNDPVLCKITVECAGGATTVYDRLERVEVRQDRPFNARCNIGSSTSELTPGRFTFLTITAVRKAQTPQGRPILTDAFPDSIIRRKVEGEDDSEGVE